MIQEILQVEEIHSIVEEGITAPLKCRLTDKIEAFVKYPNNPCGNFVLINEYLGSSIAQQAEVSTWEFGICKLSNTAIDLFSNGEYDIDDSNSGLCFFSVAMPKIVPKVLWNRVDPVESAKIILLDHILINLDRHRGNTVFDLNSSRLVSIDYSHIFGKREGICPNPFSQLSSDGMDRNKYLFNDILVDNADVYEQMFILGRLTEEVIIESAASVKQALSEDYIRSLMNNIPEEWKLFCESDKIERLTSLLLFRIGHLEAIAEMIIKERRDK